MCGIAGIVGPGARARPVEVMLDRLRHRGPDGSAVTGAEGHAVLGACRLAITGLGPTGDQPMTDPTGRFTLVFNGEIYNHVELRHDLGPRDYRGMSDTETLLYALAAWGPDALPRLAGIFAFALLDRAAGTVLLARDRCGVKPLYLAEHAGGMAFASELRALAAVVPATADGDVLRRCLADYWVDGPETPLSGFTRLEPGTLCEILVDGRRAPGGPAPRAWHRIGDDIDPAEEQRLRALPAAAVADEVEAALSAAVARRLPAESPGGVLCSGGLDSSLVLALTRCHGVADLPVFVAGFPDQPGADESGWAARACATTNPLHRVDVDATAWREHFVAAVRHFEYPFVHQNAVVLGMIAAHARALGVRVLLSGEGADELFGGYASRHRAERARFAAAGHDPTAWTDPEPPSGRALAAALGRPRPPGGYAERLRSELADAYAHHDAPRAELSAALAADLRLFLGHGLNRLDKNLMQHAVEVREPFLDQALVRLALNLPLERRVRPRLKGVLLDVGRRHLPEAIVDREKVGFTFDVGDYLKPMRPAALAGGLLREMLGEPAGAWRSLLAALTARELFRVWSAEIWCRAFVAGHTNQEIEAAVWR